MVREKVQHQIRVEVEGLPIRVQQEEDKKDPVKKGQPIRAEMVTEDQPIRVEVVTKDQTDPDQKCIGWLMVSHISTCVQSDCIKPKPGVIVQAL